jgi:hypothetical protein
MYADSGASAHATDRVNSTLIPDSTGYDDNNDCNEWSESEELGLIPPPRHATNSDTVPPVPIQ